MRRKSCCAAGKPVFLANGTRYDATPVDDSAWGQHCRRRAASAVSVAGKPVDRCRTQYWLDQLSSTESFVRSSFHHFVLLGALSLRCLPDDRSLWEPGSSVCGHYTGMPLFWRKHMQRNMLHSMVQVEIVVLNREGYIYSRKSGWF